MRIRLFTLNYEIKLLDPGAGTGSLTTAFIDRAIKNKKRNIKVEAWEIEPLLQHYLDESPYSIEIHIQTS